MLFPSVVGYMLKRFLVFFLIIRMGAIRYSCPIRLDKATESKSDISILYLLLCLCYAYFIKSFYELSKIVCA